MFWAKEWLKPVKPLILHYVASAWHLGLSSNNWHRIEYEHDRRRVIGQALKL
jgi:hypothetical protein